LLNAWLPCWNGLLYSYLYPWKGKCKCWVCGSWQTLGLCAFDMSIRKQGFHFRDFLEASTDVLQLGTSYHVFGFLFYCSFWYLNLLCNDFASLWC
jgi:hypothetical protein